jgi:hypothetical protein
MQKTTDSKGTGAGPNVQPTTRSEEELDREPASNRGTKGQLRASRRVARSEEEVNDTLSGRDDLGRSDRADK